MRGRRSALTSAIPFRFHSMDTGALASGWGVPIVWPSDRSTMLSPPGRAVPISSRSLLGLLGSEQSNQEWWWPAVECTWTPAGPLNTLVWLWVEFYCLELVQSLCFPFLDRCVPMFSFLVEGNVLAIYILWLRVIGSEMRRERSLCTAGTPLARVRCASWEGRGLLRRLQLSSSMHQEN
jgi:hypothetical protein